MLTPFGNPDGSRSDIQDVMDGFVSLRERTGLSELQAHPDDLSIRVIVGAKGSGKTVYLRRLQAIAANNESVYADTVRQDLPVTSTIVKFCQVFKKRDLIEKWMQLWYCAILRALVSHLLHAKRLAANLEDGHREELGRYPEHILPPRRRHVSIYSQVTEIVNSYHTERAFMRFFDDPAWAELDTTIGEILAGMPPIYFFVDSVDEEYASAPLFWLQCQTGLFYRAMRFLRDQQFGGRLHVIVCVRDHVLANVLRGEHQNRYRGEPHIAMLSWDYPEVEFFLEEKIAKLDRRFLMEQPEDSYPTLRHWLGHSTIVNKGRHCTEPLMGYLLRHTRLLPRDVVALGNKLCELVVRTKESGQDVIPLREIRHCVRDAAASFGNEQLAICANHIASSEMPPDAARKDYIHVYTSNSEYARGFVRQLTELLETIGKDRFGREDLEFAQHCADELFGVGVDPLSVLWQNQLLGYSHQTPDGPGEVFFSEMRSDHFVLPRNKAEYLLHSCLMDCAQIRPAGPPVGIRRDLIVPIPTGLTNGEMPDEPPAFVSGAAGDVDKGRAFPSAAVPPVNMTRLLATLPEGHEIREGIERAQRIAQTDPEMALARLRKVLDWLMRDLYARRIGEAGRRPLENLIQHLVREKHFPARLEAYSSAVRLLGNVGAHRFGEGVSAADVHHCLAQLSPILEWYLETSAKRRN